MGLLHRKKPDTEEEPEEKQYGSSKELYDDMDEATKKRFERDCMRDGIMTPRKFRERYYPESWYDSVGRGEQLPPKYTDEQIRKAEPFALSTGVKFDTACEVMSALSTRAVNPTAYRTYTAPIKPVAPPVATKRDIDELKDAILQLKQQKIEIHDSVIVGSTIGGEEE